MFSLSRTNSFGQTWDKSFSCMSRLCNEMRLNGQDNYMFVLLNTTAVIMDEIDFSITSDPKRISNQIEFVELMLEKDCKRLETLTDEKDMEILNYVLKMSNEILKSLQELQHRRTEESMKKLP